MLVWRWFIHLLIKHRKYKFREWIDLEDRKILIARASGRNNGEFPVLVASFLSDALHIPKWVWMRLSWMDVWAAYLGVSVSTLFSGYLPLTSLPVDKMDIPVKQPWEYDGRTWFFYSSLLAHEYGWSVEYIANLKVFDAMAYVQEILFSQQMNREFEWSMSEASVLYDEKSKTTKPNPLPRPYWMTTAKPDEPLPIPKINIPKNLLPIGVVNYDALTEEYKPKEVDTP